jgi:hypothetical protein
VARAIMLAIVIVTTYAVMVRADLNIYWVEFALAVAAVIGIGALVAVADVQRPFGKAAILSFGTIHRLPPMCVISPDGYRSGTFTTARLATARNYRPERVRSVCDARRNGWSCRHRYPEHPGKAWPTI